MDKLDRSLPQRRAMLDAIETDFIKSDRGQAPQATDVYKKAINLMTSKQMEAFINEEKPEVCAAYGNNNFGSGLPDGPPSRRSGVPFVEVDRVAGTCTAGLQHLERSACRSSTRPFRPDTDLARGLLEGHRRVDGRIRPHARINQDVGRDHWAPSWSVMMGGGGLEGGRPSAKPTRTARVVSQAISPEISGRPSRSPGDSARHRSHLQERPSDEDRQRRHADQRTDRLVFERRLLSIR